LESQFPRANQAAIIALGRPLEQRDNYFPIHLMVKGEKQTDNFLAALNNKNRGKPGPGEPGFTKETKPGAKGSLNLDAFSVYFRHLKQVEQFIHMAPVAKSVGDILNTEKFQQAVNDKTSGHGTKVLKKWLNDSIRGHAFDFDTSLAEDTFLWLRRKGVMFTIARNIPSTLRQALSLTNVVAMHPVFAANMSVHMAKSIDPRYFKQLEDRMKRLSPEMRHRNFERFLARIKHDAQVAGVITGKESWDERAFSWQKWFDNRTVVNIWNAVYDSAQISEAVQKQFEVDGSEERAIHLADKIAGRTQPMGDVEHLPDFFRGGTIATLLSTFQRQVSNNWNLWAHDIIGMRKAGKISKKMAAWRILFSYIIPSQIFGLISRGGLPDDWEDAAFDLSVYGLGPIFLAGRVVINAALGFAGGQTSVEDIIPATGSKAIAKLMRGDIKGAAYQGLRVAAQVTGRFPNQYFRTGEGVRDIMTGETDDLRRLIYSDWSLTNYGWPGGKEDEVDPGFI
jgi:hypothetical protein